MATIPPPDAPHPSHCPLLGVPTIDRRFGAPIDYPSFENRCWSAVSKESGQSGAPIALLLTDQATLCLCSAYRECPRFLAARAARRGQQLPNEIPHQPALGEPDDINQALQTLSAEVKAGETAHRRSRRRWGWIGAGLIFMSSLLCGGIFAGYVGWQLVSSDLAASPPGTVDTLAAAPTPIQPQVYLIVTATSEPSAAGQPPVPGVVYPAAVTPTPRSVGLDVAAQGVTVQGESLPSVQQDGAAGAEIAALPQAVASAATPLAALPDMQLEIPTRRPTPILDIPTSTPAADTPTPTSTATPQLGTPVVIFAAGDDALEDGKCTMVTWHVENVRAVYYENLGVDGHGEKEECLHGDSGDYNLVVILGDNSTRTFTATVSLIVPTNTPQPTPTFTEEAAPTPTWTSSAPTETPTPPIQYGAKLDVNNDGKLTCARGTECETEIYVTNSSTVVDNITVSFSEAGAWSRNLCRLDGVCAENGLTVASVGPGNTGVIRLQITVPDNAEPGDAMTYRLFASSDGSGGTVQSGKITVTVTAE